MDIKQNISKYLTLKDVTLAKVSQQAIKPTKSLIRIRKSQEAQPIALSEDQILDNLKHVATLADIAIKYCEDNGWSWQINSGLRDSGNKSDHNRGGALDLQVGNGTELPKLLIVAEHLRTTAPDFRQLIVEIGRFTYWLHLSTYKEPERNWRQCLAINTKPRSKSTTLLEDFKDLPKIKKLLT